MKKRIFIFLLLVSILLVMLVSKNNEPKKVMTVTDLPWQVEQLSDSALLVFGVVLGEATLNEAAGVWGGLPSVGLFVSSDQSIRLEAYFGKRRVGIFDAHMVARLGASDEQLKHYFDVKLEKNPMPSGDYKHELPERELTEAYGLPVMELTYIPIVDYTEELVRERFGEPSTVKKLSKDQLLWLYPEKSLAIILSEKDKDILHYVTPARFEELAARF